MKVGLIGAPSSGAGHWPGMEQAPAFVRDAGLPDRLREAGVRVVDHGDLPRLRWRADPASPHAQNLELVTEFLAEVAQRVDSALGQGELPLVIGGECTVTIGAIAGFLRHYDDLGLMYVDGHVDLNTPTSTASGVLDSMVMTHLLGQAGATAELRDLGPRTPMLAAENVVCFGYNEGAMNPIEVERLPGLPVSNYPLSRIADGDVRELARDALTILESKVGRFVLHLDVDVISFTDFPIANVPTHHVGLTFEQAMECVEVFASSDNCVGAVVTEINPNHSTEAFGDRFTRGLARALTTSRLLPR